MSFWFPHFAPVYTFAPKRFWALVFVLFFISALLYWLTPEAERFNQWFSLPSAERAWLSLPTAVQDIVRQWQRHLPDFSWALLMCVAARDLQVALFGRSHLWVNVVGACSWELGQAFNIVIGHFDIIDLTISLVAGLYSHAWPFNQQTIIDEK